MAVERTAGSFTAGAEVLAEGIAGAVAAAEGAAEGVALDGTTETGMGVSCAGEAVTFTLRQRDAIHTTAAIDTIEAA